MAPGYRCWTASEPVPDRTPGSGYRGYDDLQIRPDVLGGTKEPGDRIRLCHGRCALLECHDQNTLSHGIADNLRWQIEGISGHMTCILVKLEEKPACRLVCLAGQIDAFDGSCHSFHNIVDNRLTHSNPPSQPS